MSPFPSSLSPSFLSPSLSPSLSPPLPSPTLFTRPNSTQSYPPSLFPPYSFLSAKFHSIQRLDRQLISKLVEVSKEFSTDHELTVSLLDYTVDSSGLALLISPFKFQKLFWFLVILSELLTFSIICAMTNYFTNFEDRIIVCLFINFLFYVITYVHDPFQYRFDRILDSIGRIFVFLVGIILIICQNISKPLLQNGENLQHNNIPLYDPLKAYQFFFTLNYSHALIYFVLDAIIVVYMYIYIFFIIQELGVFSYFQKKFKNIKFAMHDHILNFLMKKIRVTTLGFENIYIGTYVGTYGLLCFLTTFWGVFINFFCGPKCIFLVVL